MQGNGPHVVCSLGEAINLSNQYPAAIAFMVAPLARKTGGKRSWHVLKVEGDGEAAEAVGWCTESSEGAKLPTIEHSVAELPELPPSKIGVWELAFIDSNSDILGPRVWIDPAEASRTEPKPQPKAEAEPPSATNGAQTASGSPQPSSPTPAGAYGGDVLLQAFKAQIEASQNSAAQSLAMMKAVTDSIGQIGKGYGQVQELLMSEVRRQTEQSAKSDLCRDAALGANTQLQQQLAESRENSQIHLTIRELYKDKPELFTMGVKELLGGLMDRLAGKTE